MIFCISCDNFWFSSNFSCAFIATSCFISTNSVAFLFKRDISDVNDDNLSRIEEGVIDDDDEEEEEEEEEEW